MKGRITRLERRLPIGIEAELRALTDEELLARVAKLSGVSVEEVRAWTPEECRLLQDEILSAMTKANVLD